MESAIPEPARPPSEARRSLVCPPFTPFPVLETQRLILREIRADDTPAIFDLYADETIAAHVGSVTFSSHAEAQEIIEFMSSAYGEGKVIRWGITLRREDRVIGSCGFHRLSTRDRRAEIGYDLSPTYWRQGIMREALRAMFGFGFETMHLHRIEAMTYPANIASWRLLEALGFTCEGLLRDYAFLRDTFEDVKIYSLLETDDRLAG